MQKQISCTQNLSTKDFESINNMDVETTELDNFIEKETDKLIDNNSEENNNTNNTLLISEKTKRVFLPYSQKEISLYLEQYPNEYSSAKDVIKKEFILSLDYYMKHPVLARFREAYSLMRDRESKSIVDAFKFALDYMFRYELNPVIIAACKTQQQFENYILHLEKNDLDNFTDFEIKFEINPI